jgi:CspA family cold shock protein
VPNSPPRNIWPISTHGGGVVRSSLASVVDGVLRVVDRLLELTVRLQFSVREDVEVPVATGTIKKVVSDRGFGFIAAEDGKEYFFHRDGLTAALDFDRLAGGERVEFDIEQSPKGLRAKNVKSA